MFKNNPAPNSFKKIKTIESDGSSDQSIIVDSLSYFSSQPLLTTGVTKTLVCAILYLGWCI